jgi:fructosamine-3-kinase
VSDGTEFFVKTARQSADSMFKGEALGLMAMYHAGAMRIPKVFHFGDDGRGGRSMYALLQAALARALFFFFFSSFSSRLVLR